MMFEALLLLFANQVAKPADPPVKDTPKVEAKQATKDAKQPVRLRRRGETKPVDQKEKPDAAKPVGKPQDEPPPVELRNIPGPQPAKKKSDLDEQLLNELGKGLESAKQDEADPLLRAQRRMRKVEEDLAKTDATTKTVEVQKQIVADLDELLNQANQNPNRKKQKQQQKQRKQNQKDQQQQQQQQQANSQRQSNASKQGQQESRDPARKPGGGRSGAEQRGAGADSKDIWGHLSKLDHQQVIQYARENFLPKYRDVLEQYFETIATKSRSKE